MTTPGGVPNLPAGALTIDNLASKTQDMTPTAMRGRANERFPSIFDSSTGGSALSDLTPIGIINQIFAGFSSVVANADPADVQGPDDLPGLLIDFIESLPVIGELVGLLEAILGTYTGDDETLLTVQQIFAPIRMLLELVSGIGGGVIPTTGDITTGWGNIPVLGDVIDLITQLINSIFGGLGASPVFPGVPSFDDLLGALGTAFGAIPGTNVTGSGGIPNVDDTFTSMWDLLGSAFNLSSLTGLSLDGLAGFAQGSAVNAATANQLATINTSTLGIRTNKSVTGALERTTVSNFPLTQLGTGATPANFAVTQAASAIGIVRMPESDTKGTLYWRSSGNSSISAFYLNFGKMALDGSVTPLFSSGNLSSQLTSGWKWQQYTFASSDEIVHSASENIVAEFQVVGAGTVTIAGLDMAWMDDHPAATTKRSGATRNNGASGPTALSIGAGSVGFTGKTPWVGLGRSTVPVGYIPPSIQAFSTPGPFSYTIPSSLRVAGTLVDYWAVGSGGGGQSGGYFLPGQGGECGNWQYGTLVYGTHIPLGTATISGSIAASAAGGFNPFVFDNGDNGTSTTITIPTYGIITATGGTGGGQSGNSQNGDGQAAGNRQITDYIAFGGASAGQNQPGNTPGGGGGAGYPAVGRASGAGGAWLRTRQP